MPNLTKITEISRSNLRSRYNLIDYHFHLQKQQVNTFVRRQKPTCMSGKNIRKFIFEESSTCDYAHSLIFFLLNYEVWIKFKVWVKLIQWFWTMNIIKIMRYGTKFLYFCNLLLKSFKSFKFLNLALLDIVASIMEVLYGFQSLFNCNHVLKVHVTAIFSLIVFDRNGSWYVITK